MPEQLQNDWTIFKLLSWAASYFKEKKIDSPRLTAEILLANSLGIKRIDLYLQYDRPVDKAELARFKSLLKRRIKSEPVAYIIGEKGFYASDFKVNSAVLIPRPETELLVEKAIEILQQMGVENRQNVVLELGTGSGAIVVSLAKAIPENVYMANDISMKALSVARENAVRIMGGKIHFFAGSWFSSLFENEFFDLIVSNPPYIPANDVDNLQHEVRDNEPHLALDGGSDGLACYRDILMHAYKYLRPKGRILLEIGYDQKQGIKQILEKTSRYKDAEFIKDLPGQDRMVIIKKQIDLKNFF